jgi:hypothetical protein
MRVDPVIFFVENHEMHLKAGLEYVWFTATRQNK